MEIKIRHFLTWFFNIEGKQKQVQYMLSQANKTTITAIEPYFTGEQGLLIHLQVSIGH